MMSKFRSSNVVSYWTRKETVINSATLTNSLTKLEPDRNKFQEVLPVGKGIFSPLDDVKFSVSRKRAKTWYIFLIGEKNKRRKKRNLNK